MDKYPDFASLQRHESDYSIECCDRGAPVTILAPHGGAIEPHTAEIARAVAGTDHNYFLFIGRKPQRNRDLHITSHRWDEPQSVALVARSTVVVTVHGTATAEPVVVLGGRDIQLRELIAAQLTEHHLLCRPGTSRNSGLHPANICNRGRTAQGVQLEIARTLRDSPDCWQQLAAAVRAAISRHITQAHDLSTCGATPGDQTFSRF